MSTGSLAGSVCYESVSLATDSYFAGLPPSSFYDAAGNLIVTNYFEDASLIWWQARTSTDSLGNITPVYTSRAVVPSFSSCYAPSESFADGVLIGWALAAVFGIVFFVKILGGVFKNV